MSMSSKASRENAAHSDESPPVLGTWGRFYAVVIANTILVYLLLLLFSYYAARS